MEVATQASALAEQVRHIKWLLSDHAWDMSIVIDDGWEAPPAPPPAPEPTDGEDGEGEDDGDGDGDTTAAPEPPPPAPQGPAPGPGVGLAAALVSLLGGDSNVAVQCTSAWVAPEAAEGAEAEPAPEPPTALIMGIQASAVYAAEPPAEPEEGEEPSPQPALALLPCFDTACHVGQLGEFVASVADGAQVVTAAVPGASSNRLVSILQDTLVPSMSTAVPGSMVAFSVPAVKAAIEAGVTAPKCVELELIMRVSQSGSEEEPASCAVVNYIGNPHGLSVEAALPTVTSLRALEPPPAEPTEADEAVNALADEVAACAADPDVAAAIQSDLSVELIEAVENFAKAAAEAAAAAAAAAEAATEEGEAPADAEAAGEGEGEGEGTDGEAGPTAASVYGALKDGMAAVRAAVEASKVPPEPEPDAEGEE